MSNIKTLISVQGVCEIVDKGELSKNGNVNSIGLRLASEKIRKINNEKVVEEDVFNVRFWSSAADIINDEASVGDSIWFIGHLRNKKGIELKIDHFELYKKSNQ
jgi:single-stranded DNA-binding protein